MQGLPQDLKHYSADSFALFTTEELLAVTAWVLFICWLADRLEWLV